MRVFILFGAIALAACDGTPEPEPEPEVKPEVEPALVAQPSVNIVPSRIPSGYGFPGDRAALQALADEWKIDEIRATAWNLWGGMTADSPHKWHGVTLPVWDTWCGSEEVWGGTCATTRTRPSRGFELAAQLTHSSSGARDTQVVSFNKFNPSMSDYLARPQAHGTSGSQDIREASGLAAINAGWGEAPSAERKLDETPYVPGDTAAIETKPVIFVVKAEGLTPLPLWQGPSDSTASGNAVPESWKTCVLVDPLSTAPASTAPVPATDAQKAAMVPNSKLSCDPAALLYAPLSTLYSVPFDADAAAAFNTVSASSDDQAQGEITAEDGDYGVLVAMHVNTKEIINWTWQTFWWQPGGDTPDAFPGSKAGMTDKVTGTWRNYAMCTGWNQTKGSGSTEMVVCFNPYLETSTGIPAGQTSNCMTCHGTATAGALDEGGHNTAVPYPPSYTTPIDFDTDPRFDGFTRTDFAWSIQGNAIVPPASTP